MPLNFGKNNIMRNTGEHNMDYMMYDLFETDGYKYRILTTQESNHKRKVLSEAKRKKIIELIDKHTREVDDILASWKTKGWL